MFRGQSLGLYSSTSSGGATSVGGRNTTVNSYLFSHAHTWDNVFWNRRVVCRSRFGSRHWYHHHFLLVSDQTTKGIYSPYWYNPIWSFHYSLQFPMNGQIGINTIQAWWGNTVFTRTGDWNNVVLQTVPPGKTFGWVWYSNFTILCVSVVWIVMRIGILLFPECTNMDARQRGSACVP